MAMTLIYDGGCPFCRHFALVSELSAGIPGLTIRDGRTDSTLRHQLRARGLQLADGAVLLEDQHAWHGSAAIAQLCRRMKPSDPLLHVLKAVFKDQQRSSALYPTLLLARRVALRARGLPIDPDRASPQERV